MTLLPQPAFHRHAACEAAVGVRRAERSDFRGPNAETLTRCDR